MKGGLLFLLVMIALTVASPADSQSEITTATGVTRETEATTPPINAAIRVVRQANNYGHNYEHGNNDYERGYAHGYNRARQDCIAAYGHARTHPQRHNTNNNNYQ